MFDCAESTAVFTGQILIIVACSILFGWVLTVNQIPAALTQWLVGMHLPLWSLLLAINIMLLLVGSFMDPISAILLLTPLLVPLMKALGVDPFISASSSPSTSASGCSIRRSASTSSWRRPCCACRST